MKRSLKIFYLYALLSYKTIFQTKLGVVFLIMGKVFRFLFLFSLIYLIFSKTKLVKGYTLDQMIIFYLTFNIIDSTVQILYREVYRFRPQIVSGSFDLIPLKPHHPFFRILLGGVDFLDIILIIPYVLLLIFFALKIETISFVSIISYLTLILNSFIIATSFHIIVLALAILTTEVDHTIMIYRDITGLARFPLEIYKQPIQGIFTFVIPVGIMMSFPAKALLGLLNPATYLFSFFFSILFLLISLKLWKSALTKYQSWGG